MTLTKTELIESLFLRHNLSKKDASKIIKSIFELTKRTLGNDEDILISGFGKFYVKNKNVRKGRNPATGDAMMLDARRIVSFKCSGKIKNRLNN